jgi:peroxidase
MHTIFVREHNRIADFIKTNNPTWTDEKVFQEGRRFVSAEMQHITYNEFLPKILHNFFMTFLDLKPKALGYFGGYDTTIKPMIRNAFATAAYRFGHSLLKDRFTWGSSFPFLHTQFNNPDLLYPLQGIEKCTGGLYEERSQRMDEKLTTEVTNKLFKTMTDLGGDLAAFNIQRGRDHGLPPYNDWLEGCYGIRASTFEAGVFRGLLFHNDDEALKLKDAYE